jgi:hypothetical protein
MQVLATPTGSAVLDLQGAELRRAPWRLIGAGQEARA